MSRILVILFLSIVVDAFYFPVSFTFLPASINTKIMMGAIGGVMFGLNSIGKKALEISKEMMTCLLISLSFSLICYVSTVINNTDDMSYASYTISFLTWTFGAYGVCDIIRRVEGEVKLSELTWLIVGVCLFQCVMALVIDNNVNVKRFVDSVFSQGQDFYNKIDRLYGIGAALDPAGVRFSTALILLSHQICTNKSLMDNRWKMGMCLSVFFAITIIGNMIARTTSVGTLLGLVYVAIYYRVVTMDGMVENTTFSFYGIALLLLGVAVGVCVMLYNTNPSFHSNIRFAFEGFFNWAETGVWRTDSTDKLNSVMWKWPDNPRSWVVGNGLFDNWVYGTDIGYCRFVLYCGVIGLSAFAFLFFYCSYVVSNMGCNTTVLALLLIACVFTIWIKVATDILFIYVLLMCTDKIEE